MPRIVRRLIVFLLALGALLGLLGQQMAAAHAIATPSAASVPAAAGTDCASMMKGAHKPASPCGNMTLDCIAGTGCAIPVDLNGGPRLGPGPQASELQTFWTATRLLAGGTVAPETHPPSRLG